MQNVVQYILEVVKFNLEVAQVVLYAFGKMNLAQKCMVNVSFKGLCRHKAADLTENCQVSNRVQ